MNSLSEMTPVDRQKTVLIFGGTGTNFWHYFSLLKGMTLEDLRQFKAIYGISGGSGCLFMYVLYLIGHLNLSKLSKVDYYLRHHVNKGLVFSRLNKFYNKKFIYQVSDLMNFMEELSSPQAMSITFSDFCLSQFHVVTHNVTENSLFIFNQKSTPQARISEAICHGGFPRKIGHFPMCQGNGFLGLDISDFDFSSAEVKADFRHYLKSVYPEEKILFFNLFKSHDTGNFHYVKVSKSNYPRLEQFRDLSLAFLGIPNRAPGKMASLLESPKKLRI